MSHKKFGPDRFSRFDVYWIQTSKQTDTQTDKPNLYIDYISIHENRVVHRQSSSLSTLAYTPGLRLSTQYLRDIPT